MSALDDARNACHVAGSESELDAALDAFAREVHRDTLDHTKIAMENIEREMRGDFRQPPPEATRALFGWLRVYLERIAAQ